MDGNNNAQRSYVWGLDLSGTQIGAGGIGGLVMTTIHTSTNAGTYLPAYDGNGNVSALINASNGEVSANYEYGPFGEPIRVSGVMSKENPFRFSTKRTVDSIDIILYEYRAYSPRLGKWLSRDLIDTQNGANIYSFVGNNSLNSFDILGLWDSKVHNDKTLQWATKGLKMPWCGAARIAYEDNGTDNEYDPTLHFTDEVWSWHFDRSSGGEDSRNAHTRIELSRAKMYCLSSLDNWEAAAVFLGRALHADQDWVAHGDFNRWLEAPNIAKAKVFEKLDYAHNTLTPIQGQGGGTVDNPDFDADGPNGRPTIDVLIRAKKTSTGDQLFYTRFHQGHQRVQFTEQRTKDLLSEFMDHIRTYGKRCGKCWKKFLPDN
ncbi:MAG TPA: RHS repeat-associated core domain-containing protein [Verrucomicrobiota bacterium]|nr:RHS repeat-associated core domain-containing protein [Verrucomicrobiota bacterium]